MDSLPTNTLGEVLIQLTLAEIITLSVTCLAMNHLVSITLNSRSHEGEEWWHRKTERDFPDTPEEDRAPRPPPVFLGHLAGFMSYAVTKSAMQKKEEMLRFGLRWNEAYICLSLGFMTALRISQQGGMSTALSYLSTQVDVAFSLPSRGYYDELSQHYHTPILLSPEDVTYLLENELEEVVWHAIETNRRFPLGQRGKTHSLERLLKSDRMTPFLLVCAMISIASQWRADLSPALGVAVNHPNAKTALLSLFITAASNEEAMLEMLWRLPSQSEEAMTAMLCSVISHSISCLPLVFELLSQGANPSDVARAEDVYVPYELPIIAGNIVHLVSKPYWQPVSIAVLCKNAKVIEMLVASPLFTGATVDASIIKGMGRSRPALETRKLVMSLIGEGRVTSDAPAKKPRAPRKKATAKLKATIPEESDDWES